MSFSTGIEIKEDGTITPNPLNIGHGKKFHFHNESGNSVTVSLDYGLVDGTTTFNLEDSELTEPLSISPNASGDYSFTITHHSGGLGGGTGKIHVND